MTGGSPATLWSVEWQSGFGKLSERLD